MALAAVVLAAGAATRYGAPKQRELLPAVLARLRHAPVGEIVVVTGAHAVDQVDGVTFVHCSEWERGPGASLRAGLATLALEAPAAVVCLADGPTIDPRAVGRVIATWQESGEPLVAASYGGERGHPLVIGRGLWDTVPDEGARSLPALLVPCDDLEAPGDLDTQGE